MENEPLDINLDELNSEGMEKLSARLTDLRKRLEDTYTSSDLRQQYLEQDGNLDRWNGEIADLQMKIGATIVNIEKAGGNAPLMTDEEHLWADKARDLMG